MRRREAAFTILELMIAMAIVMLVLYAAINFFIVSVRQYKVQTKIVETNIEGILGLEFLRQDLESLGFGLPWDNVTAGSVEPTPTVTDGVNLTATGDTTLRAVVSRNNPGTGTVNGSDFLVIRSTRVGMGSAAGKWTTLQVEGITRRWGTTADDPEEDLDDNDYVIVLSPTLNHRTLLANNIKFSAVKAGVGAPTDNLTVTNIVYGIDNTGLKFPWNRADYYIDNTLLLVPQRCAPKTGVLVKQVVSHKTGDLMTPLPLLDCVADMQIVYGLDTDANPLTDLTWSDVISGLTAEQIRTQLKEVRVYILAQEGQRDGSYSYKNVLDNNTHVNEILVGPDIATGRYFDLSGNLNYRWKIFTIVVKPRNLAQ